MLEYDEFKLTDEEIEKEITGLSNEEKQQLKDALVVYSIICFKTFKDGKDN